MNKKSTHQIIHVHKLGGKIEVYDCQCKLVKVIKKNKIKGKKK